MREAVGSSPLFSEMPWGPPVSHVVSALFSLGTTVELRLISSEASHRFFKTKQKLCANVPNATPQQLQCVILGPLSESLPRAPNSDIHPW